MTRRASIAFIAGPVALALAAAVFATASFAQEGSDLELDISACPDPVTVGDEMVAVFSVFNRGPDPAIGVSAMWDIDTGHLEEDVEDPRLEVLSATPSRGSCEKFDNWPDGVPQHRIRCLLGTLPVGETAEVLVVAKPIGAGWARIDVQFNAATDVVFRECTRQAFVNIVASGGQSLCECSAERGAAGLRGGGAAPPICDVDPDKSKFFADGNEDSVATPLDDKRAGTLDSVFLYVRARDDTDKAVGNRPVAIEVVRTCNGGDRQTATITATGKQALRTDAAGELRINLGALPRTAPPGFTPGEYTFTAVVDGVRLRPTHRAVFLGPPSVMRSQLVLSPRDVWANGDDRLGVELRVRDECNRSVVKNSETSGPSVHLQFRGPEEIRWPENNDPALDRAGVARFSDILFEKEGDYSVEGVEAEDQVVARGQVRAKPPPIVEDIEIIQTIGFRENAGVPLPRAEQGKYLVGNRPTVVRVSVRNRDRDAAHVAVTLKGSRGLSQIGTQRLSMLRQPGVGANRLDLATTYNFLLPQDWVEGTIGVETMLEPKDRLSDRPAQETFQFHQRALDVRWLVFDNGSGVASASLAASASDLLRRLYPLSKLSYAPLGTPVAVSPRVDVASAGGRLGPLYRALSPRPDFLFGWLPLPNCDGSGDWRPTSASPTNAPPYTIKLRENVASGTATQGCAQKVLAHELAHDFLLMHPDLGSYLTVPLLKEDFIGVGGTLGFPPKRIEDIGLDTSGALRLRQNDVELMSQRQNDTSVWISQTSWKQIFDRTRGPGDTGGGGQAVATLLVRGSVSLSGAATLQPSYPVAPPIDPPEDGPYCLWLRGAGGEALHTDCFSVSLLDHYAEPLDRADFYRSVPHPPGLASIVLTRNEQTLAEQRASPHRPTLEITAPRAGENWDGVETLRWSASDADGDTLSYLLQYSPDDRVSWIPLALDHDMPQLEVDTSQVRGGDKFWLRVIASDGLNATTAETGPIAVPKKSPQAFIVLPEPDTMLRVGAPLLLQAASYDLEDGGLDGAALTWTSDRTGPLASGALVAIQDLPAGPHRLTLTARDRDGNQGTATADVLVIVPCVGDCDESNAVTIAELIIGVNIALGSAAGTECRLFDADGDREVRVNELVTAVAAALNGCPPANADTPTATAAATPSTQSTTTATATRTPIRTQTGIVSTATPRPATATPIPPRTPTLPLVPTPTRTPTPGQRRYCQTLPTPLAIPDGDPAGVSATMMLSDAVTIADLDARVVIPHMFVGDLIVRLTHESTGTTVRLIDRPGFVDDGLGCPLDDVDCTLDDEAAKPVEDECADIPPALAGRLTPNEALSVFDGENLAGLWRLNVSDALGGDTGALTQWCLELAPPRPPVVTAITCNGALSCEVGLGESFTVAFTFEDLDGDASSWSLTAVSDDNMEFPEASGLFAHPSGGEPIARTVAAFICPSGNCRATVYTFVVVVTDATGAQSAERGVEVRVRGSS